VRLTLREFRQGDFTRLWEIDQECFPPGIAYSRLELLHYIRRAGAFTFVAESVGDIVGFSVAERTRQRGHVITLDVRESFRRAGVASMLMDAVEERFVQLSCGVSLLETAVDNVGAIAFYKRRGYTVLKTIPRYYERNLDALLMGKKLHQQVPQPQRTIETSE
jgi:ribosomal protein S18 acetylase RimI-like enzyme